MFFPRLITLLVCLGCEAIAAATFTGILPIPLEPLEWLVIAVTSFFAIVALVTYIGLTDAMRTEGGALKFGTDLRGRMMREIRQDFVHGAKPHCCDMYVGTSKAVGIVGMLTFTVGGTLLSAIFDTLQFFIVVGSVVVVIATFVGLGYATMLLDKKGWLKWPKKLSSRFRLLEKARGVMKWICVGIACMFLLYIVGAMFFVLVYLPISSLMMGHTLLVAIGIYLGTLALLPIPLYCMGGKKLLLKTKVGEELCPVVE
ncbi:MAG TPA: hypothetical protein VJJ02_04120 [Candidatus Paceibacterota bacterium]